MEREKALGGSRTGARREEDGLLHLRRGAAGRGGHRPRRPYAGSHVAAGCWARRVGPHLSMRQDKNGKWKKKNPVDCFNTCLTFTILINIEAESEEAYYTQIVANLYLYNSLINFHTRFY